MLSQPALSAHIRRLEAELGVSLFKRTTRRVQLTPPGAAFVARAERMLADADSARREMREFDAGIRGTLRLGAWFTVNPSLPSLLAEFIQEHSRVEVMIREENSEAMLELLRAGELDVALATMHDGLDVRGVEHLVYVDEPFVAALPPTWDLAQERQLAVRELADVALIAHKTGSAIRRLVESAFEAEGLQPRVLVETNHALAARSLVASGIGASLVPITVARLPGPPVAFVGLENPPRRVSVLAWKPGPPAATKAFVRFFSDRGSSVLRDYTGQMRRTG